jgi:aryl-alcohol dehydrogenase-like predicted oxidoreductase
MLGILNSKLILGTVQMGLPYGINNTNGKGSLDDSLEILGHAFDNGIRILDSAEAYGNAHEIIGIFHNKYPDKIFKVITKLPNRKNDDISAKVEVYLKELNVNQLETLMFHSYDSYQNNIENFNILNKLKLEKKIKSIGVSVYTNDEIEKVILNDDIDIIQLPFNLFDNTNLRSEILMKAKSKGKIIHTRSALLQGLFFKDLNDRNKIVKKLKKELALISEISRKENTSISALALSYCLLQKTIDNVLIGVDSLNQLKDNIKSIHYKITPQTIEHINTIKIKNLDLLNPSLWK